MVKFVTVGHLENGETVDVESSLFANGIFSDIVALPIVQISDREKLWPPLSELTHYSGLFGPQPYYNTKASTSTTAASAPMLYERVSGNQCLPAARGVRPPEPEFRESWAEPGLLMSVKDAKHGI